MIPQIPNPAAMRTWVDFVEEHVTQDGGPIKLTAVFHSEDGAWSLVCSAAGTVAVDPEGVEHVRRDWKRASRMNASWEIQHQRSGRQTND